MIKVKFNCISNLSVAPAKHLGKNVLPVPGIPTKNTAFAL